MSTDTALKYQPPKGALEQADELIAQARQQTEFINTDADAEVQTDKAKVKVLPCTQCGRPLVVSTFYVAEWAKCSTCNPKEPKQRGTGQRTGDGFAAQVHVGKTDPATVVDLASVLVNPSFATVKCPIGGDEHRMELKCVNHNDHYGPTEISGFQNGRPQYRQTAVGETVMHQCLDCRCVISMTTTAVTQFRRINEIRKQTGSGANAWAAELGSREEE